MDCGEKINLLRPTDPTANNECHNYIIVRNERLLESLPLDDRLCISRKSANEYIKHRFVCN